MVAEDPAEGVRSRNGSTWAVGYAFTFGNERDCVESAGMIASLLGIVIGVVDVTGRET